MSAILNHKDQVQPYPGYPQLTAYEKLRDCIPGFQLRYLIPILKSLKNQVIHGSLKKPYPQAGHSEELTERKITYQGKTLGRLRYFRHVPVINYRKGLTPKERGFVHAMLVAESLYETCRSTLPLMFEIIRWDQADHRLSLIKRVLESNEIYHRAQYDEELAGLEAGFREWGRRVGKRDMDDLVWYLRAVHYLPNVYKRFGENLENGCLGSLFKGNIAEGCSSYVGKQVHAHNLDWVSGLNMGNVSGISVYEIYDPLKEEERIIIQPDFLGHVGGLFFIVCKKIKGKLEVLLTGSVNELGRFVNANGGLTYTSLMKEISETCTTAREAYLHAQAHTPVSSVCLQFVDKHFTEPDTDGAMRLEFHPDTHIRVLLKTDAYCTNHSEYPSDGLEPRGGQTIPESISQHTSEDRLRKMRAVPLEGDRLELAEKIISAAGVPVTVRSIVVDLANNCFKMAYGNYHAHQLLPQASYIQLESLLATEADLEAY